MPQCHFTRQLTRSTLVGIGAKRRPCNVIFIGTQIARATVFHLRCRIFRHEQRQSYNKNDKVTIKICATNLVLIICNV